MKRAVAHFHTTVWPGGGPAGYLHNLRAALQLVGADDIVEVVALEEVERRTSLPLETAGGGAGGWRARARRLAVSRWILQRWYFGRLPADAYRRLADYPIVVFHDPRHARWYLRVARRPQRIFVMPHTPVDVATEEVAHLEVQFGPDPLWEGVTRLLRRLELRTYAQATGVIVPCAEAVDEYFAGSRALREAFQRLRLIPLPSGAPVVPVATMAEAVRRRLGIGDDQVAVGFFGRYHEHKGFDVFGRMAELATGDGRFVFLSAGAGYLRGPSSPNYRDLGWLAQEYGSHLAAVDVVVSPNRATYFDLGTLEAMALAKPVMTSPTGGNRYLARLSEGVILVDPSDPEHYLARLRETGRARLRRLGARNRQVYDAHFTLEAFGGRHRAFAERLLAGPAGE